MSEMVTNTTTAGSQSNQLNAESPPPAQAADSSALSSSTHASEAKAPAESSVTPTSQADKLGSKFAALSRKERMIVAKQQEIKDLEAKIAAEKAKSESEISKQKQELDAQIQELKQFQALKKANPVKALEALGYTYEQLTQMMLQNDGKPTPEMLLQDAKSEMQAEISKLKQEQAEREAQRQKEREEAEKRSLEAEQKRLEDERVQAVQNFQNEILDYVAKNQDTYELININSAQNLIFATVEKHFEDTGRVLSIKEASDLVEQFLEEQVQRNLATKKLKAKVSSPSPKTSTPASSKTNSATSSQSRTLTNDMTASSMSSPALSESERMKRALAALDKIA